MKPILFSITFFLTIFLVARTMENRKDSISLLITKTKDDSRKLDLMIEKFSYSFFTQNKLYEIEQEKDKILAFAKKHNITHKTNKIHLTFAYLLQSKFEHEKAKNIVEGILNQINKQEEPEIYLKASIVKYKAIIKLGLNSENAEEEINDLLNFALSSKNAYSIALINELLAFFYCNSKSNFLSAAKFGLSAIEYVHNLPNKEIDIFLDKTRVYCNQSVYFSSLENYEIALDYLNEGLLISNSNNNFLGSAFILFNIGHIYNKMEIYDKALNYFNQSYEIANKHGITTIKNYSLIAIGEVYLNQKEYNLAKQYFREARLNTNDKFLLSEAYKYLGTLYLKQQKLTKGKQSIDSAIHYANQIKNFQNASDSYLILSKYYNTKGNLNKAIENANTSLKYSKSASYDLGEIEAYKLLYEQYKSNKNFEKAHKMLRNWNLLNDSLNTAKHITSLKSNKLLKEHIKKMDSLKLVQQHNQVLAEQKSKRKKSLAKTLSFGGGLFLIILFIVCHFYSQKRKLSKSLLEQEIELSKLNLINNNLLSTISENDKNLFEPTNKTTKTIIHLINNNLLSTISENDKNSFESANKTSKTIKDNNLSETSTGRFPDYKNQNTSQLENS